MWSIHSQNRCLLLHTNVCDVVPGLDEAFPYRDEAAGPTREEVRDVGQRKHVVDTTDEALNVWIDLLSQAAQPGFKQDR